MDDLREKIARVVAGASPDEPLSDYNGAWQTADAILAIPELKEALRFKAQVDLWESVLRAEGWDRLSPEPQSMQSGHSS
jgi:Zn/Cd-binding protein ZinT